MPQSKEIDHALAMINYLSTGLGHLSDSIKEELIQNIKNTKVCDRNITEAIARLGDASCLHAYADTHGTECFSVLRTTSYQGIINPIKNIGVKNADHFVRCVEILAPILITTSRTKLAAVILRKAKEYDTPDLIWPSLNTLGLTAEDICASFFTNLHTFEMKPAYARWLAEFMEVNMTLDHASLPGFGAHVDALLRKGDVHGVAAYIKLGFDIRPGFEFGLIRQDGNEWFNRLARQTQSAHDLIDHHSRLPQLQQIFAMDSKSLTHLIAGKSNKEIREEKKAIKTGNLTSA